MRDREREKRGGRKGNKGIRGGEYEGVSKKRSHKEREREGDR